MALADPATQKILEVAITIALLVLSLGIHEAAHGWVALKRGDTTARDLGRLTLNPLAHIDPFLTVILPAVMYFTAGVAFGGAKPVPVNYFNLRHPLRDMALVALAGPASNFLLSAFFLLCIKVVAEELGLWGVETLGYKVLTNAVVFNLWLAAFNLLPIPPLDGSRVMTWLLPRGLREPYARLETIGLLLVFFLILFVRPVQALVNQTVSFLYRGVEQIVTLGGAW